MTLNLTRITTHQKFGTFGVLAWNHEPPFAVSLEDPWRENRRNVSCIPEGIYDCLPWTSPTHGQTYQVMDVPNRTYILFHKGNTHINTQGCILVAEQYTNFDGLPGVGHSGLGFNEFMALAPDEGFSLKISEIWS